MSGNLTIQCVDIHVEIPPAGGTVPAPHRFSARPRSSCAFVRVGGGAPLVVGDRFDNEAVPDHAQPKTGGAFANGTPSGEGEFTEAGQGLVYVGGKPWMCLKGRIKTCSDAVEERPVAAAAVLTQRALVMINGSAALTGAAG